MYPANALVAAPLDDLMLFDGVGSVLSRPSAEREQGGPVGSEVGAETGPYTVIPPATGAAARQALAEQLFAAHYPKLAGWVRRLVDDDDTAHEIASEAFVRLLSRWTSPGKLDNPQSYLYMIATNLVRDHWRKTERERRALRSAAAAEPEPYADPAADVDVRDLLASLPARLRDPFLLHYYGGFAVHEIGQLLKRPDGTIKADLYHARARLKQALAERGSIAAPAQRPPAAADKDRRRRRGMRRTNAS